MRKHDQDSAFDDNILPLRDIAEALGVELQKMERWASPSKKNGFPKPVDHIGRYRLYDKEAITIWYYKWMKVSKHFGQNQFKGRTR